MNKEKILENYATTQYNNKDFTEERLIFARDMLLSIPELNDLPETTSVLELGCGMGGFAKLCEHLGIKNYTGVDLSKEEISIFQKEFDYKFYRWDVLEFLKVNKLKYDVIFMSQVFEHLTIEEGEEILKLIYNHLTPNGRFINSMPNANGYYNTPSNRYNDLTHKVIYNVQSFSQMLRCLGYNNFTHRNSYVGHNKLQHTIHNIYRKLFELHLKVLGYARWKVYTHSMITILRKNE